MNNTNPLQLGTRVLYADHPEYGFGIVKLVEDNLLDDCRTCQVAFEWMSGLQSVPETALRPTQQLSSGSAIAQEEWGGVEDIQRRLGAALVMSENSRTGSFLRSFTSPLPHQAFLLDKIVSKNLFGHLIADDVGMGKTIEAGLVIATIRQRKPGARVLILSPAGVVLQWQDEMDEHFGLEFSIAGRDFKTSHLANWKNHQLVLSSLDSLKMEDHRQTLSQIESFDLVVCDEAHRLTARREFLNNELYRTQNYRFVEWMVQEHVIQWVESANAAPRSPFLLLLTATPHQGDDLRFAYILQLVRPDKIDAESAVKADGALNDIATLEECITRTPKRRAVDWNGKPIFKGHESRTLDVDLQPEEQAVLQSLSHYVLNKMRFANGGNALIRALAMHTFQKIAASSWAALELALVNRLGGGTGVAGDDTGDGALGGDILDEIDAAERKALNDVLSAVRALPCNSKWDTFRGLIQPGSGFRELGDRLLVFTQYRRTQEWLCEKLTAAGEKVAIIHGGLSLDERKSQRLFFEAEATVLISTEAGSEGANLQKKCHLEINFDLPWNPMRLLQRIGRLDRYGQKHKVLVANLRAPKSWDSEISVRISQKLANVQASMGLVADEDYRTMILGEIHEAISVAELMQKSDWGRREDIVDTTLDKVLEQVLSRKPAMDRLFRESMGMPEGFEDAASSLGPDDFRKAFSWVAAGQDIRLKETRTADKRFLKGVYHFTLPPNFKGGLRASREAYLVFDREVFGEVRGEVLGVAKGQEIKPSLAGFGDPITDWFFRSGLQAGGARSVFSLERDPAIPQNELWWIAFAARWKPGTRWVGPDACILVAAGASGEFLRAIPGHQVFSILEVANPGSSTPTSLPDFSACEAHVRDTLRQLIPKSADKRHLAFFSTAAIAWS